MKLEDIGFYSLNDQRALTSGVNTRLERCELLLTKRCNFNCLYCRHVGPHDATWEEAKSVVDYWIKHRCRNMRFSGGEPTLWPYLTRLVAYARSAPSTEHIAISTNGSASLELYNQLIEAGVNDFSVSLDACCAAKGGEMIGGDGYIINRVMEAIRYLSERTYVTIGTVILPTNQGEVLEVIKFALDTKVTDVRLISAAQWDKSMRFDVPQEALERFPILKYRITNMNKNRNVRGMVPKDCGTCRLMLDDMAISEGKHYTCIIHMREGGCPIGTLGPHTRQERLEWVQSHNCHNDPICHKNCLDVCIDYNNRADER